MKKLLISLLCLVSTLQAQVEYEYPVDHGGALSDALSVSEAGVTVFTFHVAESQTVSRIRLRLALSHTWISDIEVILKSPDGTEVRIFDGIGGDGGIFVNTYIGDVLFTDAASDDIGRAQQGNDEGTDIGPWTGSFSCEEQGESEEYSLSSFIGKNSRGTWQLIVRDYVTGDDGYVYAQHDDSNTTPSDRTRFGISLGTALLLQFSTAPVLSDVAQWRLDCFGTPANSGYGGNRVDFDKDGVINLVEYALGRDPKLASATNGSSALPVSRRDVAEDEFVLALDLPSPIATGVQYIIQASVDLDEWNEVAQKSGAGTWLVSEGSMSGFANGPGRQIVEFTLDAGSHTQRWMRLQVIEEP